MNKMNKRRTNFRTKYRVKKLNRKKSLKKKNTKRRNYKKKKYTKKRQYKNKNYKGGAGDEGRNMDVLDENTRSTNVVITATNHKIIQYCISDKNPYENISIKVSVDQNFHHMTLTKQYIKLNHYSSDSAHFVESNMDRPPVNIADNEIISIDRTPNKKTYIYIYLDNSDSMINSKKVYLEFGKNIDQLANDIKRAFEMDDYYEVLGVGTNPDKKEITKASKELVFEFLLPSDGGFYKGEIGTSEEIIGYINQASQTLSDPEKLKEYKGDYINRMGEITLTA